MTVFTSPHPPVELPDVSLPGLIRDVAERRRDAAAIIDAPSGRSLSYAELMGGADRVAAGLAARGFGPDGVLVILAPNLPEWPVAALGAMSAGGVVSGANPLYTVDELTHQLVDSGASFILTVPPFLEVARKAAEASGVREVFVFGEADGATAFRELVDHVEPSPDVSLASGDLAALPYSSGTTGRCKGVQLTHGSLVANVTQFSEVLRTEPDDVIMAFLPMFHIFGFTVVTMCTLAAGARLVSIPMFDPEMFLGAIQEHRVNKVFVVPPVMNFLAFHPMVDDYDLESIEIVGCGAAPLGEAVEQAVATRLDCEVGQGFGMTESSGVVSVMTPGDGRPGASGQLLPGTEARIVDSETGADLGVGETGELWFRGPQVFSGYLNNPEATAATLDSDGWLHSGDLAHFDESGWLWITDRLKELIKVKGFQVPPAELEALLLSHDQVGDAAVIGRPDERSGEVPVAYVVPNGDLDPEALQEWVASRVTEYKQLHEIIVVEAIPKNPSGKILRRVLRDQDASRS
jgi:acyl-CoA synthetase (AMP-forming)/AMP-acid ligase II